MESSRGGGQHGDSAHMTQLPRRLDIGCVEHVLDRNAFGLVLGYELLQADGDARKSRGHGVAWGNFDGSADDADESIFALTIGEQIDYPVAGVFRAAIDAEDAHG